MEAPARHAARALFSSPPKNTTHRSNTPIWACSGHFPWVSIAVGVWGLEREAVVIQESGKGAGKVFFKNGDRDEQDERLSENMRFQRADTGGQAPAPSSPRLWRRLRGRGGGRASWKHPRGMPRGPCFAPRPHQKTPPTDATHPYGHAQVSSRGRRSQ